MTLQLADDSPVRDLPWVVTFGPLDDDEEWDPVVCGPYERGHALGLAEAVVTDEPLMAVVEPLLARVSAAEIRADIDEARRAAQESPPAGEEPTGDGADAGPTGDGWVAVGGHLDARDGEPPGGGAGRRGDRADADPAWAAAGGDWTDPELADAAWTTARPDNGDGPAAPPTPEEVRAGLARIAARLTGRG